MQQTKALVVCIAVLILGLAPTASAGTAKWHTVTFSTHFFDPGGRITGLGPCSEDPSDPYCSVRLDGITYFHGPLTTFGPYFCYGYPDPLTLTPVKGECWQQHMGFLAGCGWGSFVEHYTGPRIDPAFDPATGTVLHFTWQRWVIVPGSGTGAFAGARGSGTEYGDWKPDVSATGVHSGQITCRA
jgi:hypothetical protein